MQLYVAEPFLHENSSLIWYHHQQNDLLDNK